MKIEVHDYTIADGFFAVISGGGGGGEGWELVGPVRPSPKEAKKALKRLITEAYIEVCIPKKVRKMIKKYKGEK